MSISSFISPATPKILIILDILKQVANTLADGTAKPLIELKPSSHRVGVIGEEGDMVLSLNEATGKLEPHRVLALLDMGVKPVYRITTESGKQLKTTLTHPYLTRNGWRKLEELKVGEEITVMKEAINYSRQSRDPDTASGQPSAINSGAGEDVAMAEDRISATQGVEGGKTTGLGGLKQSGADIRADKDGVKFFKFKSSGKNNGIAAGKVVAEDKLIGLNNISRGDFNNPDFIQKDIFAKFMENGLKIYRSYFSAVLNPIKSGDKFCQAEVGNNDLGVFFLKDFDYNFASYFPVVAFYEGGGVKEIGHLSLKLIPHLTDFFSYASANFRESPMNFFQGNGFSGKPFPGDIISTFFYGESHPDKVINSNPAFCYRHNFFSFSKDTTTSSLSQGDLEDYSFLDILGQLQEHRLSRNSEIIADHLSPIFFSMVFPEILPDWIDALREAKNPGREASISSSISSIVSLSSTNPRVAPFASTNLTIPLNENGSLEAWDGFNKTIFSSDNPFNNDTIFLPPFYLRYLKYNTLISYLSRSIFPSAFTQDQPSDILWDKILIAIIAKQDFGKCLTPDSLITLADGTAKPLIELKPSSHRVGVIGEEGDMVLSLNEATGRLEPHWVLALLDMGVKPVYRITTASGKQLKTTLTHPYLTKRGWKKLSQIKAGEEVAVAGKEALALVGLAADLNTFNKNSFGCNIKRDTIFAHAKTVSTGRQVNRRLGADERIFQRGVISQFFINTFLDFFRQALKFFCSAGRKLDAIHKEAYANPSSCSISLKGTQPFFFASAIDFLRESTKSGLRGSLDSILSISQPAGFTDLSWYSSVDNLSMMASSILESTSKSAGVSRIKIWGIPFLSTMTAAFEPLLSLNTETGTSLLKGISFANFSFSGNNFIYSKFNIRTPALSSPFLSENEAAENTFASPSSDILWDKIISIEPLRPMSVYDIEVEATHNFVAQGILAHNTYTEKPVTSNQEPGIAGSALENKGGIDLNPQNLEMEIRGEGISSSPFTNIPFDLQNFQGFSFQIISIQPVKEGEAVFG